MFPPPAVVRGVRDNELLGDRLHALSLRTARVVELRYFGGLAMADVAEVLGTSLSTVERDWRSARTWLASHLKNA